MVPGAYAAFIEYASILFQILGRGANQLEEHKSFQDLCKICISNWAEISHLSFLSRQRSTEWKATMEIRESGSIFNQPR